jgi:hypothetical protein
MRLFVLILVLAATPPATATIWEASPDLSPQATHSSLEVTIVASDGSTDVNGSGIVFRGGGSRINRASVACPMEFSPPKPRESVYLILASISNRLRWP